TSTCASCGPSTDCAPRSSWDRTSCSFWASSRVDLAAGPVEQPALHTRRPVPVERVRLVQIAIGGAVSLEVVLVRPELVPRLRILGLATARLPVELEGTLARLRGRPHPQRLHSERVERVRRLRLAAGLRDVEPPDRVVGRA